MHLPESKWNNKHICSYHNNIAKNTDTYIESFKFIALSKPIDKKYDDGIPHTKR